MGKRLDFPSNVEALTACSYIMGFGARQIVLRSNTMFASVQHRWCLVGVNVRNR